MPRIKKDPGRLASAGRFLGSSVVDIKDEISRWNGVMETHNLENDMQVAQILLDCYDFIGSSSLTWTNKEKDVDEESQSKEAVLLLKQKAEEVQLPELKEDKSLQIDNDQLPQTENDKTPQVDESHLPQSTELDNDQPVQFNEALLSLQGHPPQSAIEACLLKQRTDEGQTTLNEIHALMVINEHSSPRLSKRNQMKAQKVLMAAAEEDEHFEEEDDNEDRDFVTVKFDDQDYKPQAEDTEESDEKEDEVERGRKRKRKPTPKKAELDQQKKAKRPAQTKPIPKQRGQNPQPKRDKEPVPKKSPQKKAPPAPRKRKTDEDQDDEQSTNKDSTAKKPKPVQTYRLYQCNDCQTTCESANDFKEHYKMHMDPNIEGRLSRNDIKEKATFLYKCVPCDLIVKDVLKHRRKHGVYKDRICEICGMFFKRYSTWKGHMRRHESKEAGIPLQCPVCPKWYIVKADLHTHMSRYHSNHRSRVCEVCGKSFKDVQSLSRHKLTHTGIKALKCPVCGKGFTNNYNLKGHLRTHTGEKPFKCDICSAAFTHNVSLKTHKKSAHGIDMWKDQKTSALTKFDRSKEQSAIRHTLTTIIDGARSRQQISVNISLAESNAPASPITFQDTSEKIKDTVSTKLAETVSVPVSTSQLNTNVLIMEPVYAISNPRSSLISNINVHEPLSSQSLHQNMVVHDSAAFVGNITSSGTEMQRNLQYGPYLESNERSFRKL